MKILPDTQKKSTAVITCSLVELQGWPPPSSFLHGTYDMSLQIFFAAARHNNVIKPLGDAMMPCWMILLQNSCGFGNSVKKQKVLLKFLTNLEAASSIISSAFLLSSTDDTRHRVCRDIWHPCIVYKQLCQSDMVLWKYTCDCRMMTSFKNGGLAKAMYIALVSKMCTVPENCWICKYYVSKVVRQFIFGSALYEGLMAKNTKLVKTRDISMSSELLAASKSHAFYILGDTPRPTNYMVVRGLNILSRMFYGQALQSSVTGKRFEETKQGSLGYYFIVFTLGLELENTSVNVGHRFFVALLTHIREKPFIASKHNFIVRIFGLDFKSVQFDLMTRYKQVMFIVSISLRHGIFSPLVDRLLVDLFLFWGQQISAAVSKLVPNGVFLGLIAWSLRRENNPNEGYPECYRAVTGEFVCHPRCPIFSWHLTILLDFSCLWSALNAQLKCKYFWQCLAFSRRVNPCTTSPESGNINVVGVFLITFGTRSGHMSCLEKEQFTKADTVGVVQMARALVLGIISTGSTFIVRLSPTSYAIYPMVIFKRSTHNSGSGNAYFLSAKASRFFPWCTELNIWLSQFARFYLHRQFPGNVIADVNMRFHVTSTLDLAVVYTSKVVDHRFVTQKIWRLNNPLSVDLFGYSEFFVVICRYRTIVEQSACNVRGEVILAFLCLLTEIEATLMLIRRTLYYSDPWDFNPPVGFSWHANGSQFNIPDEKMDLKMLWGDWVELFTMKNFLVDFNESPAAFIIGGFNLVCGILWIKFYGKNFQLLQAHFEKQKAQAGEFYKGPNILSCLQPFPISHDCIVADTPS